MVHTTGTLSFRSPEARDPASVAGGPRSPWRYGSTLKLTSSRSRFAEIEAVTTIALIVTHYELSVTEDRRFANETWEQRKERVLAPVLGTLTLGPVGVPLTLKRRL